MGTPGGLLGRFDPARAVEEIVSKGKIGERLEAATAEIHNLSKELEALRKDLKDQAEATRENTEALQALAKRLPKP